MIVSHASRFIFFHNPKCAGTSFRDALKPWHDDPFSFWGIYHAPYFRNHIDHTHLRLWEFAAQFPQIFERVDEYNSLIFVRDPRTRFLSAVNEHFKKFQSHIPLAHLETAERTALVETFIRDALNIARITTDWRFVHFSPQVWFLKFGGRTIPRHIVPMDERGSFARDGLTRLGLPTVEIPHHNPSPVDLRTILKSPLVEQFIRSFYEDDLAFLKADPALAGIISY